MDATDIQVASEQQARADDTLSPFHIEKASAADTEQQQPLQYEDDFSSSSASSLSLEDKSSTEEAKLNEQASVLWQRGGKILDYPEHSESPQENQSPLAVSTTRPSASRLMQASSQQKRTSKRIRRSSDHHKRAAVSNHNRKVHANKQPTATATATATTTTTIATTTTTAAKSPVKQQLNNERVVRTDEIALFMRCKKRYSDPDFKPIPPSPGGWDEVTPDRVIDWEKTANMVTDFSSYNQPNTDWNAVLPWARDDDVKTPTLGDNAVAGTDSTKSRLQDTSRKPRQDPWKPALNDTPTTPSYPPPLTLPLSHGKRQESLTTSTHVKGNNNVRRTFPDRFLNQPSIAKSAHQLFEQRTPTLWDIGPRPYHRRSSTYSLDIQTNNPSLTPVTAPTRRLSYGHENSNRSQEPLAGACSPWSPNPTDWSMYRVPPHQQEWTPPASPWSPDRKRNSYFNSALFPPDTSLENIGAWEERCASILKVVDDDTSKDDIWTPPKDNQRRSSYNDANWSTRTANGDGMALLVANSQLLQNMVQTGHMGCRHCGSGTHSISRNCPYIPTLTIQDAWLQLLHAANRRDTELFMEAIDIYSKSQPNETFPSIARRLQDAQSILQLVAFDKAVPSTTVLVDLQGRMRRKYVVVAVASPSEPMLGVFDSVEQNMTRLAEAGFARDLTEIAHCMLCKQSGHWAKDCTARKPQHPPLSQPQHDYLPRRKQFTMADPTLSSKDTAADLSHRLYYSLNEYVLVDGI